MLCDHRNLAELLVGVFVTDGHQLGVGSGGAGLLDDIEQLLDDFSQVGPLVHRVVGQRGAPVLAQRLAVVLVVVEELKKRLNQYNNLQSYQTLQPPLPKRSTSIKTKIQ